MILSFYLGIAPLWAFPFEKIAGVVSGLFFIVGFIVVFVLGNGFVVFLKEKCSQSFLMHGLPSKS